ncbi:MAG TPA: SDR family oxidoreductase [Candidatus Paceibacterota bacterium]|nr:SDR family oxidoreductase [Verrucomicrobiota bacterium]HRY49872.1 SDR family oxidoreductase [Candidatus Paceibacterota bacterium]HSA03192.1 SDR family oxidoreductase [Candidatus Paceibacterota bacterium]
MRALIVGCGYVGLPLGAALVKKGHEVFGLRRSPSAASELKNAGIQPLMADITCPETLTALPRSWDWVVNTVSAGGGGLPAYRQAYLEGTRNLMAWLKEQPPKKYVYTSSTGVYGQTDGSAVKEESPTVPAAETGRVLVETERVLIQAFREHRFPVVILRVAGIYGPGRGHWFQQFLKNEARIEGRGERLLNMVHRDDVAGIIVECLESAHSGSVYNVVDDEPITQWRYFHWLADTLGRHLPPAGGEVEPDRKRGLTNKKVLNRRLKMELGYQFKYPTFREGLTVEIQRLEETGQLDSSAGE